MTFQLKTLKLFGLVTTATLVTTAASASTITAEINWTSNTTTLNGGTVSLSGVFSANNSDEDDFIRTNEITAFNVTFNDSAVGDLATYNLSDLVGFTPDFNFNYEISSNTLLQSGDSNTTTGFSIGSNSEYLLDTTSGTINFTDSANFGFSSASGGTVTATPVPFDVSSGLGVVALGGMLGLRYLHKRSKKHNQATTSTLSNPESVS
ncbi:MAG: hypothetical protein RI580_05200 [Halothece sp. Uz-M2-17]|nr:hypothetical protein [Halothece sp. Uz-M2-17]